MGIAIKQYYQLRKVQKHPVGIRVLPSFEDIFNSRKKF